MHCGRRSPIGDNDLPKKQRIEILPRSYVVYQRQFARILPATGCLGLA